MAFNKQVPRWSNAGTEPPESLKTDGWAARQKPPADYFNWFQHGASEAITELQQKAAEQSDLVVVQDDLSAAPATPVTIPQGVSIVNADRKSRFKDMQITGRTLVNLLGRAGNCEDENKWTITASAFALDSANKTIGDNGFKINGYTVSNYSQAQVTVNINKAKAYILLADVKGGSTNDISVRLFDPVAAIGARTSRTAAAPEKFKTVYAKAAPNLFPGTNPIYTEIILAGADAAYAYVDAIRLYEISQAEYDAIDSMTPEQVAAKYPYVDDMKHVNAVYAINPGNLHIAFTENVVHANAVVTDAYSLTLNATAATQVTAIDIAVLPNQTYTFSLTRNGTVAVSERDKDNVLIQNTYLETADSNGLVTKTITTTANTRILRFNYYNTAATGTFTFTNPMLNIGDTALPFEPQKPSYVFLPDCNLRSNADGSVADRLYMDGEGKPRAVRPFREMVLDGSLDWIFAISSTGYKRASIVAPVSGHVNDSQRAVKYDGRILKNYTSAWDSTDLIKLDGNLNITISKADSGWGEDYEPEADEIKAFFNGWKMYISSLDVNVDHYNGSGTKAWAYRNNGVNGNDGWSGATNTLPTTLAPNYTPYRLMYQLAQSVDEPIAYEGELMLYDGPNQIEMGTGIVVREAAKPQSSAGFGDYYINHNGAFPAGNLSMRAGSIMAVFRNQKRGGWTMKDDPSAYGKQIAFINKSSYDPNAAYSVTYLALDTYKLGVAPQSITGTYTPNIKETVDDAVQAITGLRRDVSVLQNTKAQKQQPQWIAPGLLSGWTNQGGLLSPAGYRKDESGMVHLKGYLVDGNAGLNQKIFVLPKGYRPKETIRLTCHGFDGANQILSVISVEIDGTLIIIAANTNGLVINGLLFPAGQ